MRVLRFALRGVNGRVAGYARAVEKLRAHLYRIAAARGKISGTVEGIAGVRWEIFKQFVVETSQRDVSTK